VSGIVCGTGDGQWHPGYPVTTSTSATPSVSPTGTAVDPYVAGRTVVRGHRPSGGGEVRLSGVLAPGPVPA